MERCARKASYREGRERNASGISPRSLPGVARGEPPHSVRRRLDYRTWNSMAIPLPPFSASGRLTSLADRSPKNLGEKRSLPVVARGEPPHSVRRMLDYRTWNSMAIP